MSASRHQDWSDFRDLVDSGNLALVVVPGSPRAVFFTESGGSRIGLRLAWSGVVPLLRLHELSAASVAFDGERYLEVSTRQSRTYQEFYAFACSLADRVQLRGQSPSTALLESLKNWESLFAESLVLTIPAQAGLFGEIWTLQRVADNLGWPASLASWRGPDTGEHDFSLEHHDVEVKTTTRERRIHTVQSETQLQPSLQRPLYLLSLQLTLGGLSGCSLSAAVEEIRRQVPPALEPQLLEKLKDGGWRLEHASYYNTPFLLRTPPVLVPVDETFPKLSLENLTLDPDIRARVTNVSYDIDVEGLGTEDGSVPFLEVLPAKKEK
ncbi:PD-(D/E)XK motif protein [Bradyrhizobium sp. AUGA SZCCT0240]|uniref:PD-(D/E)XK motif protein n=1 Tax=Bradyrhizobium sp. AUGA SZCCT0240 TaxID=2807669 RepID=UPI001BA5E18E|nr:PD-(D/E)XK motif protein [Bradyrhizobium sp. AUGA SZCCT0240]MBR1252280.1 PD-(D/E)XK motif protein [Bradyrhizobium sp. AUGA SZCCT0240]